MTDEQNLLDGWVEMAMIAGVQPNKLLKKVYDVIARSEATWRSRLSK